MILGICLFVATYALLLALPKWRWAVALCSAGAFILLGILPAGDALAAIDWNVLLMITGTMGTVSLFVASKMPSLLAEKLLARVPNVQWAIVVMAVFAGLVSAFVDNVATVLMLAPVALEIARKQGVSPVMPVLAVAVSSNLQGAATLVGDTTSILLGGYAKMGFADFFVLRGRPGMFFVVQLGAAAAAAVLYWMLRRQKQPVLPMERTEVTDFVPTALLCGTVALLIAASLLPEKPQITNGLICMALFAVGVVRACWKERSAKPVLDTLRELDWRTLLLLAGLFAVVEGLIAAGVVDAAASLFLTLGGGNRFAVYSLLVWGSVLISAFVDNIPYVAAMLPVAAALAARMEMEPYLLFFGLLSGATLGGNLTPVGASANITAIGILKKEGYAVRTGDFMRLGVPFTLCAVTVGYVVIWLIWGGV